MRECAGFIFGFILLLSVVFLITLSIFENDIGYWIRAKADELHARAEKIRKEKNNGIHENI